MIANVVVTMTFYVLFENRVSSHGFTGASIRFFCDKRSKFARIITVTRKYCFLGDFIFKIYGMSLMESCKPNLIVKSKSCPMKI